MPNAYSHGDSLQIIVDSAEDRQLRSIGTINGVAVLSVAGRNGPGTATLESSDDGTRLRWTAPGSATPGPWVRCASDGTYLLEDGDDADAWVRIQVYADYLLPSPVQANVYIADRYNTAAAQDDVTASEASSGDVSTFTVTLKNLNGHTMTEIKCWLGASAAGIEIGTNGSDWYTPNSEIHADVLEFGSLAYNATTTLHIRRTIGAAASADPDVLNLLEFSFKSC